MTSGRDLHTFVSATQIKAHQLNTPIGETYGITLSSQGIFCFKIKTDNILELLQVVNNTDWNKFQKECYREEKRIAGKGGLSPSQKMEALQKQLLTQIKQIGLDQLVGLYQGTTSGTGSNATINWVEKKLDQNNALTEIPCN